MRESFSIGKTELGYSMMMLQGESRSMLPSSAGNQIGPILLRKGKVRDIYLFNYPPNDAFLVMVATDRISAFDWVLRTPIPGKGRILTRLTEFWLTKILNIPHHLVSTSLAQIGEPFTADPDWYGGRSMLVKKAQVLPIECVVRGYLAGSAWKEYRSNGTVCGIALPGGLLQSARLPEPIFTPATKAENGHDENISFEEMSARIGREVASSLRQRSLDIYQCAAQHASSRGLILADTKFEWGKLPDGQILLIDEVLTPDSSRFWEEDQYREGINPPSFDKQFVRDWLETTTWDKNCPPPPLPDDVVERTASKYREAYKRLTGHEFPS